MAGAAPWLSEFNGAVAALWQDYAGWANDTPPPETPEYVNRKRAFTMGASMMRKRVTLMVLEDIARQRPLSPNEAEEIARLATQMARRKRQLWRWTAEEDAKLVALIRKRERHGRPKPYTRNGEVARLARQLGRTYMAVHRRMERLRKAGAGNCSNAGANGGG